MDNGASSYRRFLEGDESAFDEILDLYRENLIFFINRFVRDPAAAEDLAIDAFLELLVHKNRYNFKTSLKTYLFMIGRSRALDYLRHRGKWKFEELSVVKCEEDDGSFLEEHLLAEERSRIVSAALDTLPEEMRAAVHLVYFEGLSYEDTAKVMKKNKKQVDNLLYRTKNMLRSTIGKEGELLL